MAHYNRALVEEEMRRYNNALFMPDASVIEDDTTDTDTPPIPQIRSKRKRRAPDDIVAATSRRTKTDDQVKVKSEEEIRAAEAVQRLPEQDRVKIFVGRNNQQFDVGIDALDKSPVLKSLLSGTVGEQPYIMHPLLTTVDTDHFKSVYLFLATDEYIPGLVSSDRGPKQLQLDGLTTVKEYRDEAIRASHVYVLAKQLNMLTLEDLVLRKITTAQYHPYGIDCVLKMAKIVFSRIDHTAVAKPRAAADDQADSEDDDDPLESWIIEYITRSFQAVLVSHGALFWEVANNGGCQKRRFALRIFRAKVDEWEANGSDAVFIEDDD